jgi:hypothetical protein
MSAPKPTPKRVRARDSRDRPIKGLYRRTADQKWEAGHTGSNGRWRMETLPIPATAGLTEAREARRVILTSRDRGEDVAPSLLTVRDVAAEYFSDPLTLERLAPRTLSNYKQRYRPHIEPVFGRKKIQKIDKQDVLRFLGALAEKRMEHGKGENRESTFLSPWSRRGVYFLLSAIFGYSVERDYISQSPLTTIHKDRRPKGENVTEARVLEAHERDSLIAAAVPAFRPIITLVASSGSRCDRMVGLGPLRTAGDG